MLLETIRRQIADAEERLETLRGMEAEVLGECEFTPAPVVVAAPASPSNTRAQTLQGQILAELRRTGGLTFSELASRIRTRPSEVAGAVLTLTLDEQIQKVEGKLRVIGAI